MELVSLPVEGPPANQHIWLPIKLETVAQKVMKCGFTNKEAQIVSLSDLN